VKRQHKTDWVVPVLDDVAAFLATSGMHKGVEAVRAAIMVVQDDEKGSPDVIAQLRLLVSDPTREGNVIRFSVVSRRRL
jgi:hypothetical protein